MDHRIVTGDCRALMPTLGSFDLVIADPPYGDTSLNWDRRVKGWLEIARQCLLPSGSVWVFGSARFFMETAPEFRAAGLRYAQDVVWEKHNGSGLAADRFRRVHELIVQFYRSDAPWSGVYNDVQKTIGEAVSVKPRTRGRPGHFGAGGSNAYRALDDDGSRIMRSVIFSPSMHGRAIHPTEKPVGLLEILIRTSCPRGGLVGAPFAGSGAVGEACQSTRRRYAGMEIDPEMADTARNRLGSTLFGATNHG